MCVVVAHSLYNILLYAGRFLAKNTANSYAHDAFDCFVVSRAVASFYFRIGIAFSGSWSARLSAAGEWIRVSFITDVNVHSVITQGRQDKDEWVTSYQIQYSPDNVQYNLVRDSNGAVRAFSGNWDRNTKVEHVLSLPTTARSVALLALTWYGHVSLRFDVTGCQVARKCSSF